MHAPDRNVLFANRSAGEWLVSLPAFFILLTVIFLGTGEYIHSQLLKLGESQWDQYFVLRADIADPSCDPNPDIDSEVERLIEEAEAADDDELDMFAEEVDPEAIRRSVEGSRDLCRERWAIAKQNQERVTPEVRAFRAVETGVAKLVTFVGQYKQLMLCILILICAAWATIGRGHISLRPVVTRKDYYVATSLQLIAHLMLMFSEISYRNAELGAIADGVQVHLFYLHAWWIAGFGLLAAISVWQLFNPPKDLEPGGGGFGHALLAVPLYGYMAISASLQFWVIPFIEHLTMGDVRVQPYYQGIGVYLSQMMELSGMFLSLALYIWIGMLLKQTRLTELFFNLLRPWHLSPELMCFAVLVIAAWPTAYTGASGIFIIAAGAVIYQELMRSGARRQLALAATAMSGSMGVVLAPCLLVVIIAALNKDVTTGEMYHSGLMIYMLTAALFLVFSQMSRTEPVRIAPVREAMPKVIKAFGPLTPYITVLMAVLFVYADLFNQKLDEFSAPYILPMLLLGFILYDKAGAWVAQLAVAVVLIVVGVDVFNLVGNLGSLSGGEVLSTVVKLGLASAVALLALRHARQWERHDEASHAPSVERRRPVEIGLREATNETTGHIGALLMLMALSVSIGGTIERSHVMDLFPQVESIWGTMTILVITMVIIGMIMDPYGAVILVNATIAQVAFQAGIDPLHFWMFALLSFELGYLTPPVALNHLLTRHIVGEKEAALAVADGAKHGGFWYRHERILLPVSIMFVALLIVAYGPLAWQQYGWAEQAPEWVRALFTYKPY
ncbi:MAG: TRAP transporter large permease subunit [Gammaproteobacteria bacterium]